MYGIQIRFTSKIKGLENKIVGMTRSTLAASASQRKPLKRLANFYETVSIIRFRCLTSDPKFSSEIKTYFSTQRPYR